MSTHLRLLAATALVAIGLVGAAPAPVLAAGTTPGTPPAAGPGAGPGTGTADCPVTTVQDSTRAADAVFSGRVIDSARGSRTDGQPGAVFTQSVTVTRVYQGDLASTDVEVMSDRTPQQCTVGRLLVGSTYVFFVAGDGSPEDPWVASGGGGTAATSGRLVNQVERLLGGGREPVEPGRETATFTPVSDQEPTALSRAAAPGAALVIVGLLGLLVVGFVGRRRET
ncbi:MAG: hypothetical protein LH468_04235 [Nocardioides sp.]|nr:hypothetical protein [Nocardioides sp.]